ncbi:MAG: energy transducer TonB [Bacteroidetes bacterium]|nr:energy transducer TonB [Bacteroidota bacterium]
MKSQNQFRSQLSRNIFIGLSAIVLLAFTISSCGKNKTKASDEGMVYAEVDTLPVFKGGDQEILNFIMNNTTYPEKAKENNITGRVIVKFIVEKDCTVSGAEVLKGVDPLLDAEALRVVSSMPKFETPAKKDGKIVRVYFMVPITFSLQ